jgi:hypothetical protein
MNATAALRKNLEFWHWYPELLVDGLTDQQLCWQPEHHDTSILFALWHAYRADDELVHGLVMQRPSVYVTQGWADRMPVEPFGFSPFGNGATREQIAALALHVNEVIAYAKAVGESEIAWVESISDEEAATEVKLSFFTNVYPGFDVMSKLDTLAFFAIGHVSEHLGEVQMVKGMLGLKGAPL